MLDYFGRLDRNGHKWLARMVEKWPKEEEEEEEAEEEFSVWILILEV